MTTHTSRTVAPRFSRRAARLIACFAAIPLALPVAAHAAELAQDTAPAAATQTGLDGQRLDEVLPRVVVDPTVGVTASVWQDGQRWTGSAGQVANPHQNYLQGFATSRVASITKPVVTTLMLQDIEAGRYRLDDPVNSVRPGTLPGRDSITIRQILSHRSGLPDYLWGVFPEAGDPEQVDKWIAMLERERTSQELLNHALAMPMWFEPGTAGRYSNTNFVVAQMILEHVNRRPLEQIAFGRVFGPLQMYRTSIPSKPGMTGAHLVGTMKWDGYRPIPGFHPTLFGGAGAMVSRPTELNVFNTALLQGKLINKASLDQMQKWEMMGSQLDGSGGSPYGLGLFPVHLPCGGDDGGPSTWLGHDGAGFGEFGFMLTRSDAKRSVSLLYSGRSYESVEDWKRGSAAANAFLREAACPGWVPPVKPRLAEQADPISLPMFDEALLQAMVPQGRRP